jgi:two-component system LytT family sensor kinase
VSAVSITDTEKVLAFVGVGAEHHLPDAVITSEFCKRAIAEGKVVFADGVQEQYVCSADSSCPLSSALVVPLTVDDAVIGTIKLYETRNKRFLNMNKSLGEGIARLLSNQLVLSRYEQQKNLLVSAELKLLQAQVNPHFLFNSLNTVIAILRKDPDRARELLLHLSKFLRKNLKRNCELSTLEEELEHVNSYLFIEKARFEERLSVETDIDPNLLGLTLPAFTLQPLIENAIKHGIANMLEPGVAKIRAYKNDQAAIVEIEDNAGAYCQTVSGDGLGIRIVDRRLKLLMGLQYGARVSCIPNEMTRVTIHIPLEDGRYDACVDRG